MAFPAYFSVKGTRQGQFKGESLEAQRKGKWMAVLSFTMDVESPRDAATGQPSGKRTWKPVRILKEWGAASPEGLTACATNEILTEVVVEFTKPVATGKEYVYQRVTLTDATIARVVRYTGQPGPSAGAGGMSGSTPWADAHELEEWSFTFRKVEVVDNDGKTAFTDDWLALA